MILQTNELFNISHTIAAPMLRKCKYPYEAMCIIGDFIKEYSSLLDRSYIEISASVFVADDAKIWDSATIVGPTIIDHGAEIRPGAFIRGNAIIGEGAIIGNSTEIKNSVIFNKAQLPHYNYVGDSIIGYKAHMGAGAIASNLRLDKKEITLRCGDVCVNTGLRKIGVFLGDGAEVGCGCVLCPGSIIGRGAIIHPMVTVKGYVPEKIIYNGDVMKKYSN